MVTAVLYIRAQPSTINLEPDAVRRGGRRVGSPREKL